MPPIRTGDRRMAYACLAIKLCAMLTGALNDSPLTRLLEANVCRNYYRLHDPTVIGADDNVAEDLCKIDPIQSEISHISGLYSIFFTIPAFVAALPFLLSQDSVTNRRRTLLLNVIGAWLMFAYYEAVLYFYNIFDPRWVWLVGMFSFIGGGDLVFFGIIQALIAESVEQSSLSSFYIYSSAAGLACSVIGSAASLAIMERSLWLPIFIGQFLLAVLFPIVTYITNISKSTGYLPVKDIPLTSHDDTEEPTEDDNIEDLPKKPNSFWVSLGEQRDILVKYALPLSLFSLRDIGNGGSSILAYWFSKRFHWSIRDSGWIQLGITILTAIIVALTPKFSTYMSRSHPNWTSKERDLNLAKICLILSCFGTTLLGFSWTIVLGTISLVIISAGTSFADAYTGYITADMEEDETSRMFVTMEVVSLISGSFGGWFISEVYASALDSGGAWATSVPIWISVIPSALCLYFLRRYYRKRT